MVQEKLSLTASNGICCRHRQTGNTNSDCGLNPVYVPVVPRFHWKHRRKPFTGPVRLDVDWRDKSDDGELEGAVLTALAWYLGENIDQEQTVSLIASGLQEQRTELVTDRERPVLKYRLDFKPCLGNSWRRA